MAELFQKAKKDNIIEELKLDPIDDTMLRNAGITKTQFKSIIGFANRNRPLEEYKKTMKMFKKDHMVDVREYEEKKQEIDDEIMERKLAAKRAEKARQQKLEQERKEQQEKLRQEQEQIR